MNKRRILCSFIIVMLAIAYTIINVENLYSCASPKCSIN